MDQRRDRRRAFHRVGQPDVQRELRALAHGADEKQDADQRHVGIALWRRGEHLAVVQRAEVGEQQRDAQQKAEVADAVDEERLEVGVDRALSRVPEADQQVRDQADRLPTEGEQYREDRDTVRSLAADPAAAQAGDDGAKERREGDDEREELHPFSVSRSSTSMVFRLRNNTTRMARPMADSAAATVRMKNTNTCPAALPRKCEKAMKLRFTASSISSIAIRSTIRLRRVREMVTPPMAKRVAASIREGEG